MKHYRIIYGTELYLIGGITISFVLSVALKRAGFDKISSIIDYWPLYAVIIILYRYYNWPFIVGGLAAGATLRIALSTLSGAPMPIFGPFSRLRFVYPFQPQIIVFTFLLAVFISLGYGRFPVWSFFGFASALTLIFTAYKSDLHKLIGRFRQAFGLITPLEGLLKTQNILLKDIAQLWTRQRAVITLEELARSCWQVEEITSATEIVKDFNNPEIAYFWKTEIQPAMFSKEGKSVIGDILDYLDRNGDCPSVVMEQSNQYRIGELDERSTYEILFKRTLLEHSLNVAKELLKSDHLKIYIEKLMIAALAHDLGKVIGHHNVKSYVKSNHAENSVYILQTEIKGFNELKYSREVAQIIANHHNLVGDKHPLVKIFKDLDASARRYEIQEYIISRKKLSANSEPPLHSASLPRSGDAVQRLTPIINKNQMFRDLKLSGGTPDTVDISWFDIDNFISEIHQKVNRIERGWFSAITVNGDMILVLTTGVWKIIQIQARKSGIREVSSISDSDFDNALKKQILMSVTETLKCKGFIHETWIKPGYFNARFELITVDGITVKDGWYIPLRAEAFQKVSSYEEYESRKTGNLLSITNARVFRKSE